MLASSSPQRRAILGALGVPFVVRAPSFAELERGEAAALARANARGKALAVAREQGEAVIGVDTVVELDGRVYGKPRDQRAARMMLRALSGETHRVFSAVALLEGAATEPRVALESTSVRFRKLAPERIEWYLRAGEWRGRAGGYAIQGPGVALVERIEGELSNVVGLPVGALLELLPGLLEDGSSGAAEAHG